MIRILRTIIVILLMLGAYRVYSSSSKALITPMMMTTHLRLNSQTEKVGALPATGPEGQVQLARQYLPEDTWAPTSKIQVQSGNTYFYCGDWKRSQDNRIIRFAPFAIISMDKEDPQKLALTMVAESALVEFSRSMKITEIDPRFINRAILDGDVKIRGSNGLQIDGRDFIFDRQANHIRSDHMVSLTHEGNQGKAQSIELELENEEQADVDELSFSGVEKIYLRKGIEFNIKTEDSPYPTYLTCQGTLELDVVHHFARLMDEVVVTHRNKQNMIDQLRCDTLSAWFKKEQATTTDNKDITQDSANSTSPVVDVGFQQNNRNWVPYLIDAEGKQITLASEENQLSIWGDYLRYEIPQRRITVSHQFRLRTEIEQDQKFEISCQKIVLEHNEQERLSKLTIPSQGWITARDLKTKQPILDLQWNKDCIYNAAGVPAPATTLIKKEAIEKPASISVNGQVIFRHYLEKMELKSDQISVSLTEYNSGENANIVQTISRTQIGGTPISKATKKRNKLTLFPQDLSAKGNVLFNSPQISTQLKELKIHLQRKLINGAVNSQAASFTRNLQPKSNEKDKVSPENEQVRLNSDLLTIYATQIGESENLLWEQIIAEGKVKAHIPQVGDNNPATVTSDKLTITADETSVEQKLAIKKINLEGKPATILHPEIKLEGLQVTIDRANQTFSIPKAGVLQFLTSRALDGKALARPTILKLSWKEQVVFKKNQGFFYGNVIASMDGGRLQTEELEILLNQDVFKQINAKQRNEIKIRTIKCRGRTLFDMYEIENRQLVNLMKANVAEFELNLETNKTNATGPGWIKFWQYGDNRVVSMTAQEEDRKQKAKKPSWSYTKVQFAGFMEGDLKLSTGTLNNRVRALYGPVDAPLKEIDPDNLTAESVWMSGEKLETTQIVRKKKTPPTYELRATGNVEIRGELFHAEAQTVTFDQAKQLFVMRADEEYTAMISMRPKIGAPWRNRTYAKLIEFSPVNNILNFNEVLRIQGGRAIR